VPLGSWRERRRGRGGGEVGEEEESNDDGVGTVLMELPVGACQQPPLKA
jgi:hypothetical protein